MLRLGEIDSPEKSTPTGCQYQIAIVSTENTHKGSIQTEQVVFVYLGTHTHTHTHMIDRQ